MIYFNSLGIRCKLHYGSANRETRYYTQSSQQDSTSNLQKRHFLPYSEGSFFFPSKRCWLYERGSVNAYHTHLQSDSAYHPNSVRSARRVSLPITIEEKRGIVYQGKRFTREPVIVQKDIHGSKVHEAHTEREKRQITYKQRHARRHLNNLLRGKRGGEGWRVAFNIQSGIIPSLRSPSNSRFTTISDKIFEYIPYL